MNSGSSICTQLTYINFLIMRLTCDDMGAAAGLGCSIGSREYHAYQGSGMPTRRIFELIVITVVLMAPSLSMIQLWARKHLVTTASTAAGDAAAVVANIL